MAAANSITVKANDLINDAMKEIGALATGETAVPDDSADVLRKLQRLFDQYNAKRTMVYNVDFTVFSIPVNTQPITIGPGMQFDVNQRPVEIVSASLILNNTSPAQVEIPINVQDDQWWAQNRVKNLSSSLPTDLYYSPAWPNGQIFLWPVPTAANNIRLEMRSVITQITSYAQNFSMPPAYWDMAIYDLAVSIGPMFQKPITPDILRLQAEARRAVLSNNVKSPRGRTIDAGMPGGCGRGGFNYVSGLPENY